MDEDQWLWAHLVLWRFVFDFVDRFYLKDYRNSSSARTAILTMLMLIRPGIAYIDPRL